MILKLQNSRISNDFDEKCICVTCEQIHSDVVSGSSFKNIKNGVHTK